MNINLSNSPYFELGVKTALDFVKVFDHGFYKTQNYCGSNKEVTIRCKNVSNPDVYEFLLTSEKHPNGIVLIPVADSETDYLGKSPEYRPIHECQLPDITSDQFYERV